MQQQSTPAKRAPVSRGSRANEFPARASVLPDPRVILVDGYGYKICVRDNMLCVSQNGSESLYSQAATRTANGLARLVILSDDGYITGRAFAWLRRNAIAVIHCNREGNSNFMSGAAISARMVKRQVLAQDTATATDIARRLLTAKIAGQVQNLETMGVDVSGYSKAFERIESAKSVESMLAFEGQTARSYWGHWRTVTVPWNRAALKSVPSHWGLFNGRATETVADGYGSLSNRGARDFVNAMLNLAYKFAEIECVFACHAFGLHPGIGFTHGDLGHNDFPALAADLLEPCRPVCETVVLSYLDYGRGHPIGDNGKPFYWSKKAAMEADGGICRLSKEAVYKLASAISVTIAPVAVHHANEVARILTRSPVAIPFDPRMRDRKLSLSLAKDVTVADIIPDETWEAITSNLPETPGRGKWADTRTVIAAVVCAELYSVPWLSVETAFGIERRACQRRLKQWQDSGIWEKIRAEVISPKVSQVSASVS